MKLARPALFLVLGLAATGLSCQKASNDDRTPQNESPNQALNLLGDACKANFQFHANSNNEDEVLPPAAAGIDMAEVQRQLKGDGLVGHMHASVPEYQTWVFNLQQGSFFNNYQFPLAIMDPAALEVAKTLRRHDKVQLNGSILENGAAQKHLMITNIKVLEPFDNSALEGKYNRTHATPNELMNSTEAVVAVHAINADGTSLMVEYRDFVVQVVINNGALAKDLYRNDKIKIHFRPSQIEGRPLHLILNEKVEKPIEMVDRLVDLHGKHATAEGCLVLFPQSPQINRDIYALLEVDAQGVMRTWTLTNFSSREVIDGISKNLGDFWTENKGTAVNFRNKMLNTGIRVKATGTLNIVSPNQANPQILLSKIEDLQLSRVGDK